MADTFDQHTRSYIMSLVRSKDTKPEMIVRRMVYSMGYRYRLHDRKLPGTPDLVFKGRRKVIFVNGCFWHDHQDERCELARHPKSRTEYWDEKIRRNRERDLKNYLELNRMGWTCLVIWECELKDVDCLNKKIADYLR